MYDPACNLKETKSGVVTSSIYYEYNKHFSLAYS